LIFLVSTCDISCQYTWYLLKTYWIILDSILACILGWWFHWEILLLVNTFDYHLIACYALYYFITFSKKYIVTRTAIGKESLTAVHLNCGKKSHGKLNQISTWREKKDYTASLLQHSTLIDILKHLLLPSYACLTDNWWSCLILAMDIEELYFNKYWWSMLKKWTYIYIRWWYWSNIPQVVITPEARYYRYCSWKQMLLFSCWYRVLLLSCWSHILFLSFWSQR